MRYLFDTVITQFLSPANTVQITGQVQLIRNHLLVRISLELSGNSV